MIDKKTVKLLIDEYKGKKSLVSKITETDADFAAALCELFDELLARLEINSGLRSFEEFLQDYLQHNYSPITVFKLSENTFEVIANFGDLIDEAKTTVCTIGNLQFTVKTAVSSTSSITEAELREAIAAYDGLKG